MVSANASSEPEPLMESKKVYGTVKSIVGACDSTVLGISLSQLDERILSDVSTNLTSALDVVRSDLNMVLQTAKDIGNDVATVPTTTATEVSALSERLKVDAISTIASRIKILLANFQNAVEDPKSLYPRLICCDLPVDPARVVNFSRRHHLLDQILELEGLGKDGNRSMPSAPKSAVDVVTNVNSSLESVSDLLCESIDHAARISERFEATQDAAENLACVGESINEAVNQYEEVRGTLDRITSLFHKDKSIRNDDVDDDQDVMQAVSRAYSLIENLKEAGFGQDVVPQYKPVKRLLSVFVKNLTALLSRAKETVSNLVSTLRKFVNSLPRIARELRQFFIPTGFQALFLKPSPDLVSLLQSIDDLRTVLPEPAAIESASDPFGPERLTKRIILLLDKFNQLEIAQRKLFESIENQNFRGIISETVQETLQSTLQNLKSSAANLLDSIGDSNDADGITVKLGKLVTFAAQRRENNLGRQDQRPASLIESVTGADGHFGRSLET